MELVLPPLKMITSENVMFNPLSANPAKWSNTRLLPTNFLSVFDHFVGLALKGLKLNLTLPVSIPDEEKKLTEIFIFTFSHLVF